MVQTHTGGETSSIEFIKLWKATYMRDSLIILKTIHEKQRYHWRKRTKGEGLWKEIVGLICVHIYYSLNCKSTQNVSTFFYNLRPHHSVVFTH